MYSVKARIDDEKLSLHLGKNQLNDTENLPDMRNQIGAMNLNLNTLNRKRVPFNNSRWENLRFYPEDLQYFSAMRYGQPLHFSKCILDGDLMHEKPNPFNLSEKSTEFRAEVKGEYIVSSNITLEFNYREDNEPIEMCIFRLCLFKNGLFYSVLDSDVNKFAQYDSLTKRFFNFYFYSLSGTDLVHLNCGDTLDLRLMFRGSLLSHTRVLSLLKYGFFSVSRNGNIAPQLTETENTLLEFS